jgi:WD40 repeat protein/tetratricopeptide (TPR) repeat protein
LNCAAFSPKADRVAVGGADNVLRVCDTMTGRELLRVDLEGSPTDLAFGPRGEFLAVLVADTTLNVQRYLYGAQYSPFPVGPSADGKQGRVESRILLLDTASGRPLRTIRCNGFVPSIAIGSEGRRAAGTVCRFILNKGVGLLAGPSVPIPERAQVWSLETGEELWRTGLAPQNAPFAFSPDGKLLAACTGAVGSPLVLWDAATGAQRHSFEVHKGTIALAFSPDGERLATGASDGVVELWDWRTGQPVDSFAAGSSVTRLAFRADGGCLIAACDRGTVRLLSAESAPGRAHLEGASREAAFGPDGRWIAAGGPDNSVLLFDPFTGNRLRRLQGCQQPIADLVFSDDSARLAGHNGRELCVWNAETGKLVRRFDNPSGSFRLAALSSDGSRLAVLTQGDTREDGKSPEMAIQLWDVATGKLLRAWPLKAPDPGLGHKWKSQLGLVFLDGDRTLVAAMEWDDVRLAWSIETGESVKLPDNPFAKLKRERRTADGRQLVAWRRGYVLVAPPDETELQRRRALAQSDPAWHAEEAANAERDRQWFAAAFHLGRLLQRTPDDVDLRCRRARAHVELKWWTKARADADEAIRLAPRSVEARVTRALLEHRQDRLAQALADLDRAAAVAPDDPAVAAWLAFLYFVQKQDDKAAAAEKRAWEGIDALHPLRPQKMVFNPFLFSPFGMEPPEPAPVWPATAWPRLEEELTRSLADHPEAVPLLRLRGAVRAAREQRTESLDDFMSATLLAPKDALAWKGMARGLLYGATMIMPLEGRDALDKALSLDPQAWDLWHVRGQLRARDERPAQALEDYTQALKLRPDFVLALRDRGGIHAQLGQWREAVADLGRAAKLSGPTGPTVWSWLALAQLGSGDTAAYKKTCTRMLATFGRSPAQVWAGGALAAGPLAPFAAPLTLLVADQAAPPGEDAIGTTVLLCAVRPDTLADWKPLLALVDKSNAEVRGKLLCRLGRYDQAVEVLRPVREEATVSPGSRLIADLYLALAEHGRGRTMEAKRLLKETTDWWDMPPRDNQKRNRDFLPWTERVPIEQLRREVEGLLGGKGGGRD